MIKHLKSIKNLKALIICIAIPLLVGMLAGFISSNSMEQFQNLNQPPLSPPGFIFPIMWSILYILMGIASYLVLTSNSSDKEKLSALKFYGLQLIFNFFWSIIFFNFELYLFAFVWLIILLLLIIITTIKFYNISKPAGYLLIPYILWVTFAGYLNLAIYILN